MKSLPMNRKGVSPIIATLLLIVIAVASAIVAYSFVMGFIGTSTVHANEQGILSFDTYSVTSATTVDIYVRVTGVRVLTIQTAYIDGAVAVPTVLSGSLTIQPGDVQLVTVTQAGATITDLASHQLRIVCSDGTSLQIPIVKT
jgi:flagellin-like protein